MLDYGVASRGLGNLAHRCNTALGAPWAPHVLVEVSMFRKLGPHTYSVLGRAPALGRILDVGPRHGRLGGEEGEANDDGGEAAWRRAVGHVQRFGAREFRGTAVSVSAEETVFDPEALRGSFEFDAAHRSWSEVAEASILLSEGFSPEETRASSGWGPTPGHKRENGHRSRLDMA